MCSSLLVFQKQDSVPVRDVLMMMGGKQEHAEERWRKMSGLASKPSPADHNRTIPRPNMVVSLPGSVLSLRCDLCLFMNHYFGH